MLTYPNDKSLERFLIGAALLEKLPVIKKHLTPDDFYDPQAAQVFRGLLETQTADLPSLHTWLKYHHNGDAKALMNYAVSAVESTSTTAGVEQHAKTIRDLSHRRQLMDACTNVAEKTADLTTSMDETLSGIKAAIREIQSDQEDDFDLPPKLIQKVYREIEERAANGNAFVGIPSGFDAIDKHMGGFEPATETYIIARPSIGKTALALAIAENMASQDIGTVVFFSHEMSKRAVTHRRLASLSNVYLSRIRKGAIQSEQWDYLTRASNIISMRPFIVVDKPKYKSVERLVSLAESMSLERKICAVFVDHIQYMTSDARKYQSRHHEISAVSKALRDLAKELNIPVIVLCQLNRMAAETRPELHHMKESGDLEQDADVVIGIHREDKETTLMEIACLKGRDTGTWKAELNFDRFTQRISDFPRVTEGNYRVKD